MEMKLTVGLETPRQIVGMSDHSFWFRLFMVSIVTFRKIS